MIVIIDDNKINNFICNSIIKEIDPKYDVQIFENPENAIKFLMENFKQINLVLLDLNMPVIDGWDILEASKELPLNIIILTSSINYLDKEKAESYKNVKGYLIKPASLKSLSQFVQPK